MEVLNDFGHILVYGETNTGKTHFTKWMIDKLEKVNTFVFVPDTGYNEETHSNSDWETRQGQYVFTNWENIDKVLKVTITGDKYSYIVFDDYNNVINTTSDLKYKDLFTRGRHSKVRIINLVHNCTAISPTARKNCRYACIMASLMDEDEIKKLARMYYSSKYIELRNRLEEARNENLYTCLIIDKRKNLIVNVVADAGMDISKLEGGFIPSTPSERDRIVINESVPIPIPGNAIMATQPGEQMYNGIARPSPMPPVRGGSTTFGRNITNNGMYHDRSQTIYNTRYTADQRQQMTMQVANHETRMIQMGLLQKEDIEKRKFKTYNLIMYGITSIEDQNFVLDTINTLFGTMEYGRHNLEEGIDRFLNSFFPGSVRPKSKFRKLESVGRHLTTMARAREATNWSERIAIGMQLLHL